MSYVNLTKDQRLAASDQAPTKRKSGQPLLPPDPKTCVRCQTTGPEVSFVTAPSHGTWLCLFCDAERL